jgi:DNA modification methylase
MNNHLTNIIEIWPIGKLVPYARNPRTHSRQQVAQIAASIRQFGFTNPILADANGHVIAGHGRLLAASQLGLQDVPVAVLAHLTEAQQRAYVIADNQLALNAGWDRELLALELGELQKLNFDISLTGFDQDEIDRILEELVTPQDGLNDGDGAPPLPSEAVTQPGDLWCLGEHRILNGDAQVTENYARLMRGENAEMVFTDPPYNVNYVQAGPVGNGSAEGRQILNDNLGLEFVGFLESVCAQLVSHTKGAIYICMSSSELHTLQRAFVESGGHWSTFIIWAKNAFSLGRADYQRQYEPILYGWPKGNNHYWCGDRDQGDVWFIDRVPRNDLHPTMKPLALVQKALENSCKSGDIVLDPFSGSGTTLIACETLRRRGRLMELDPKYVDVAVRRWQSFTGAAAIRESDSRSFDQIACTSDRS